MSGRPKQSVASIFAAEGGQSSLDRINQRVAARTTPAVSIVPVAGNSKAIGAKPSKATIVEIDDDDEEVLDAESFRDSPPRDDDFEPNATIVDDDDDEVVEIQPFARRPTAAPRITSAPPPVTLSTPVVASVASAPRIARVSSPAAPRITSAPPPVVLSAPVVASAPFGRNSSSSPAYSPLRRPPPREERSAVSGPLAAAPVRRANQGLSDKLAAKSVNRANALSGPLAKKPVRRAIVSSVPVKLGSGERPKRRPYEHVKEPSSLTTVYPEALFEFEREQKNPVFLRRMQEAKLLRVQSRVHAPLFQSISDEHEPPKGFTGALVSDPERIAKTQIHFKVMQKPPRIIVRPSELPLAQLSFAEEIEGDEPEDTKARQEQKRAFYQKNPFDFVIIAEMDDVLAGQLFGTGELVLDVIRCILVGETWDQTAQLVASRLAIWCDKFCAFRAGISGMNKEESLPALALAPSSLREISISHRCFSATCQLKPEAFQASQASPDAGRRGFAMANDPNLNYAEIHSALNPPERLQPPEKTRQQKILSNMESATRALKKQGVKVTARNPFG
jgi:hypothetical protein